MNVARNKLYGEIPSSIGNLSYVTHFSVARNNLEGDIPQTICRLKNLTVLYVGENKLSGNPPSCLYNISSLTELYMAGNNFHGPLPVNMFHTLPNIQEFGISGNQFSAKLVLAIGGSSQKDTSTIGIKGTVGYAPPEYGMGSEVSTCGDMYSFGILVLEMLTGKRPTDEVFEDGQNLHNFVGISFPDNLMKILDPHLVSSDVEVAIQDGNRLELFVRWNHRKKE
ncbi:non-specific serine/threonine protein kinase [Trifolium repens]|nr:non-specific serine/threonine protein kinase [Trifolium repens]